MKTLSDIFPPAQDEFGNVGWSDEQKAQMQQRVAEAYRAVAEGRGSRDDADLMIVDLFKYARYLDTTPLGTSADVVMAIEGRRSVAVRFAEAVVLAGGNFDGLHHALLATPSTDAEEA